MKMPPLMGKSLFDSIVGASSISGTISGDWCIPN